MNINEHLSIEILADHAEGLLGDADSTAVSEHLASCDDCSAEADLLLSVTTLLAADDPGPMPEHFAARIDVALADLAAAEPVMPKQTTTAAPPEGAAVIDLASRRRFTGATRVTSVAASLVLLIGGAALGTQMITSDDTSTPEVGALPGGEPSAEATDSGKADAKALYELTPLPADAKKGKNGSKIDKTGKVYLKNGTQIYPDGTQVIPSKKKGAEARIVMVTSTRDDERIFTFRNIKPAPSTAPNTSPQDPAAITPVEPTDEPSPSATPKQSASAPATATQDLATGDPYVAESDVDYLPENFAANIRLLLRASGDVAASGSAQEDTESSNSGSDTTQPRAVSGAVRSDTATVDRGPATGEAIERVRRCAKQLGHDSVIAGDIARWKGAVATIVVVPNPADSSQVLGYAVSGDCSEKDPATQDSALWEQPVAKPAPVAAETTSPAPSETVSRTPSQTISSTPEQ